MKITCFILQEELQQLKETIGSLRKSALIGKIYLLSDEEEGGENPDVEVIRIQDIWSTDTIRKIAFFSDTEYSLIYTKNARLQMGTFGMERMFQIASDSSAALVYADHYQVVNGSKRNNPLISYQKGSLRDDFNFGSVLLYDGKKLQKAVEAMDKDYTYAGLYDLRLKLSQQGDIVHINEYLYTEIEDDNRKSGEKLFDYVDPKNHAVQVEMEAACTDHLKKIGAYLKPEFKSVRFDEFDFEYEASVIIPVKNRVKTMSDAIQSVLRQKTKFKFNLIVVDNFFYGWNIRGY